MQDVRLFQLVPAMSTPEGVRHRVERFGRPGRDFTIVGATKNSATGTLSAFAKRTSVVSVKFSPPASALWTHRVVTPSCSDNASCVRSRSVRSSAMRRPTFDRSFAG